MPATPSQTVGPFFGFALAYEDSARLVPPGDPDAIRLSGVVLDGAGEPVDDALVEIWQANRAGRYAHPGDDREELPLEEGFTGFGRCATDAQGRYEFLTVKPGAGVPGHDGRPQAPHIDMLVFARGLLRQVLTRVYFADEDTANAADPVLSALEDPAVRATLVTVLQEDGHRFDIRLQGDRQTAFFVV